MSAISTCFIMRLLCIVPGLGVLLGLGVFGAIVSNKVLPLTGLALLERNRFFPKTILVL